jgi:hypothetical protein
MKWTRLEFEEKADVRRLMRSGFVQINGTGSNRQVAWTPEYKSQVSQHDCVCACDECNARRDTETNIRDSHPDELTQAAMRDDAEFSDEPICAICWGPHLSSQHSY